MSIDYKKLPIAVAIEWFMHRVPPTMSIVSGQDYLDEVEAAVNSDEEEFQKHIVWCIGDCLPHRIRQACCQYVLDKMCDSVVYQEMIRWGIIVNGKMPKVFSEYFEIRAEYDYKDKL